MRMQLFLPLFVMGFVSPMLGAALEDDFLEQARKAYQDGKLEAALELAGKAVAADPKNASAYLLRGAVHGGLAQHTEAVADFDKAVQLAPALDKAYNLRGMEHFKLGHFKESLADFDKFLDLKPDEKVGHWQRGITCYYAGRYEEGAKQFEAYQERDSNDVENAVWRYLCMARSVGVAKARASLLKIGEDRRVPMRQVYELFSGRAKPEDVLAAAQAGKPAAETLKERLFYAHLYLGLYYEAEGDKKKAREHITKAAKEYKMDHHYMWDVARVHHEVLEKKAKEEQKKAK